jgi:hypothetical protein
MSNPFDDFASYNGANQSVEVTNHTISNYVVATSLANLKAQQTLKEQTQALLTQTRAEAATLNPANFDDLPDALVGTDKFSIHRSAALNYVLSYSTFLTQLGTALASSFATQAQGAKADTAVQPASIGTAAAEDVGYFATSAQGALADSAIQVGDLAPYALITNTYTRTEVDAAIAALVDSSPETLNTLNEVAAALGDDPNFATTITTLIGTKLDSTSYTAADVLTKLLTVDGAGSGLDADLLDGQQGSYYLAWSNLTGVPNFAATYAALSHTHGIADITGLQTALDSKVGAASPAFTGSPTAPTQTAEDNSTKLATTAYVDNAIGSLPGGGATNLNGLSDVTLTSPVEGNFLRRNSLNQFVNTDLIESDIPDLPASKMTSGTLDDARVAESNVTQHEGALTIADTQVTGLVAALAAKLDGSAYTAADVLAKLLTVDGPSSGLDADTIDGTELAAIALRDSPVFQGTPTAPTAAPGTNTLQVATTAYVEAAIASLIDGAPGLLDTVNELAAAIGDDENFATTVTNAIALKLDAATYTPADILTKLLTVDGASSGLDADLLDGVEGASYARLLSPDFTGTPTVPTPAVDTNTTQVASTAYVIAQLLEYGKSTVPQTTGFTAIANGKTYLVDTTSAGFTLTLPASPVVGDTVRIVDVGNALDTNTLIIGRNGELLGGIAENADVIRNGTFATFRFVGGSTGWSVSLA